MMEKSSYLKMRGGGAVVAQVRLVDDDDLRFLKNRTGCSVF